MFWSDQTELFSWKYRKGEGGSRPGASNMGRTTCENSVKIHFKSSASPGTQEGTLLFTSASTQEGITQIMPRGLDEPRDFLFFFWWIKHDSLPPYLSKVEWIQGNVLGNVNLGEYLKAASRSQKWHRKRIALLIVCVNTFWILLVSWWTNILIAHVFENDDILVLGNAINFCN